MKRFFLLILLLLGFSGHAKAASGAQPQVYNSALAYGRTAAEAREAACQVKSTLAFQIYLTLSTFDYYAHHRQALDAAQLIQTYFAFQVYLTVRTPSYHLDHDQALHAAQILSSSRSFQIYLHLLAIGTLPDEALVKAINYAGPTAELVSEIQPDLTTEEASEELVLSMKAEFDKLMRRTSR